MVDVGPRRGAGAELIGEVQVTGREDRTVRTDRGAITARWIVDASGLAGPGLLDTPPVRGMVQAALMCGIAGLVDLDGGNAVDAEATARAMAATLQARGPDDAGAWSDGQVALGFRRLAIVDLSPLGHQPMASASRRYTIVFNGEIYNHGELRAELAAAGARFRGRSDTEVVLAAIEAWGFEATLPRLRGMFAIAVWDARERALSLARDRFGEKPLYVGWLRGELRRVRLGRRRDRGPVSYTHLTLPTNREV